MGRSQKHWVLPAHSIRRNTETDRKNRYNGVFALAGHCHPAVKKHVLGCNNWPLALEVVQDDDNYDFDYIGPCVEEILAEAVGLKWTELEELSVQDEKNMKTIEDYMLQEWIHVQEQETNLEIQIQGEIFFDSIDPSSWIDY